MYPTRLPAAPALRHVEPLSLLQDLPELHGPIPCLGGRRPPAPPASFPWVVRCRLIRVLLAVRSQKRLRRLPKDSRLSAEPRRLEARSLTLGFVGPLFCDGRDEMQQPWRSNLPHQSSQDCESFGITGFVAHSLPQWICLNEPE